VYGEDIHVVDNFCPNYTELLKEAENQIYETVEYGGTKFPSVAETHNTWPLKRFTTLYQTHCHNILQFMRKYERDVEQPTYIHNDRDISNHSAILCLGDNLNNDYGAVAFWEKIGTREPEWKQSKTLDLIPNRCVIFPTTYWHSRYPRHWEHEHPRTVQVFFFDVGFKGAIAV